MKSNVNMKTKKRLLNSYIFSTLTYGCEEWTIGREPARRIIAFETWCYCRLLKISWINKTMEGYIDDKKSKGRPRRMWIDDIKE